MMILIGKMCPWGDISDLEYGFSAATALQRRRILALRNQAMTECER
jgi:hypothetical protein